MDSNQKSARIAGGAYLIYIVFQILADVIGRAGLIVYGDAAATAQNILNSAWQFRIGWICDLLAAVVFLVTAWALYGLLKPVHPNLALLFLLFNLGGVVVQFCSDLFLIGGQILLSGADYLKTLQLDQLQAAAMFSLDMYKNGFTIAQIFFGAWLFPLGYLVFKSGFLPKILGVILMVHCVVWSMTAFQFFLLPGFTAITYISYPLGLIAEFGLTLCLLVMGVRPKRIQC